MRNQLSFGCEKVKLIKNSWVVNRYQIIQRRGLNKLGGIVFQTKKNYGEGEENGIKNLKVKIYKPCF